MNAEKYTRKSVEALNAAAAFLVKVEPEDWPSLIPALQQRLLQFPRPVFAFRMAPEGLRPVDSTPDIQTLPPSTISGPYAFVSGIGDPAQAVRTVTDFMGRAPEKTLAFPDHHDFRQEKEKLETLGLPIICTEKDAVKLAPLGLALPCYAFAVKADFFASFASPDAPDFEQWWGRIFANLAAR